MSESLFNISYTLPDIENAAAAFWQVAKNYQVILFSGEMGAGKTTFIHALCDVLGVEDAVSSPTFALINEYHFSDNGTDRVIYHMDWYRLKDEEEAFNAGMEDTLMRKNTYSLIEWPEKALALIPKNSLWVTIDTIEKTTRNLTAIVK